ncbi:hypothetical protein EVA_13187 [gut metagenome]|uniref:Uncharacterized protein n=1 Tax=gut metagenome TaxID=749906 RepID=J9GAC5_9ZZZZ
MVSSWRGTPALRFSGKVWSARVVLSMTPEGLPSREQSAFSVSCLWRIRLALEASSP